MIGYWLISHTNTTDLSKGHILVLLINLYEPGITFLIQDLRIHHEVGNQLRRLRLAGVIAHSMVAAGRFEPRLALLIRLDGIIVHLAEQATLENIGRHRGARMAVRRRGPVWREMDQQCYGTLSWHVGQLVMVERLKRRQRATTFHRR